MKKAALFLSILVMSSQLVGMPELSESHKASPLEGKWLYVRASEASTLFIEKHFKGKERFYSVYKDDSGERWFKEYSADTEFSYRIKELTRNEMDILIHYHSSKYPVPERTLIYPFRDVDDTWVVIHFYEDKENIMRFSTTANLLGQIEYLDEE